MPYWLDWMIRDSKFPLPANLKDILITEDAVCRQLQDGVDPISLSINKWERIRRVFEQLLEEPLPLQHLQSLSNYIGYKTCALCITSTQQYEKENGTIRYSTDKCKVCALAKVDQCTKTGSVFDQLEGLMSRLWLNVNKTEELTIIERLKSLIDKMSENLRSLVES